MESLGFSHVEGAPLQEKMGIAAGALALAASMERAAAEAGAEMIHNDPTLDALLSKVIESGPELDPYYKAHLRRMIALKLGMLTETQVHAMHDQEFYHAALEEYAAELEQLAEFEEDGSWPDEWDIAYEELMRLENGEDEE